MLVFLWKQITHSHYDDKNHITTKLVSKTDTSNMCYEMYFLLLGQQIICIHPCSPLSIIKNVFCTFNHNVGFCLEMVIVLFGSQFTVTGMKPIWAPFKIMQINISPDFPVFLLLLLLLPSLHSLISTQSISLFLKGRMKGLSFLENQGRGEAWSRTDSCRTHWWDVMHG